MHFQTSLIIIVLPFFMRCVMSCQSPFFTFQNYNTCPTNSTITTPIPEPLSPLVTDISSITALLNTLTASARGYDGSLQQTWDLAKIVKGLKLHLGKTTADLGNGHADEREAVLTGGSQKKENEKVIDVLGEMVRGVTEVLNVLGEKAPMIHTAGYTALVSSELVTLSASTDLLFIALRSQNTASSSSPMTVDDAEQLDALRQKADEAFKKAGRAFEERKGDGNVKVVSNVKVAGNVKVVGGNGARERRANQYVNVAVGFG